MAEFTKGDKVIVRGEIAEISGTTAIIHSSDGLVAAELSQLEHSVTVTMGKSAPGPLTAVYDRAPASVPPVTGTQLSFTVTKHWARPEGEAGWTEMTCSKGSFRRVLEWMCEELPPAALSVASDTLPDSGRTELRINWEAVPDGIRSPVIAPYVPESPGAAALGRIETLVSVWEGLHPFPHDGACWEDQGCDIHRAAAAVRQAIAGWVPERPEP
jgi:hypothetical protein